MGEPIKELGGKTWEELEVLEHEDGQLMFPGKLRRRNTKGEVVTTEVRVRAPSPMDHILARVRVRSFLAKHKELDSTSDKDLFEQLEQLAILERAIRTKEKPFPQFATLEELGDYDEGCLKDIQEQIASFKAKLDPRPPIKTEEDFWRTTIAVAREADIGPLVDTDGRDQPICVVRMALEACRSPTGQHWLQSFGISIPGLSVQPSSPPS